MGDHICIQFNEDATGLDHSDGYDVDELNGCSRFVDKLIEYGVLEEGTEVLNLIKKMASVPLIFPKVPHPAGHQGNY